ncbi:MAG: radical SAM protein [Mollicutes bacterium]|nr:radical SAM protein [Mollicutes bacterium]
MKCQNTMERKSILNKTGVEYGDYTINHVLGCSHGCLYPCYAFMMAKRFGNVKGYESWIKPTIVKNVIELLEKELPRKKDKIKTVHLCFTTDPFMYKYNDICKLSLEIIKKVNSYGIPVTALTKGALPIELVNYSKENSYGITLISLDENFRKKIEPGAAPYKERIKSLKKLHEAGCKTWVSIEPYPTPNIIDQDFIKILEAIKFVDKIIFGRLHYNKKVSDYKDYKEYYNNLANQVISFCEENNINYHIKNKTIT